MTSIRTVATDIGRAAVLLPTSLAQACVTPAGHRPQPFRRLLHAVTGMCLGALSLVAVGIEFLFLARGVLYGFVDGGPYDTSWGGPTRAGAWLAHFAVGLPIAVAALALLRAVAGLHDRLGARFVRGERIGAWVLPAALPACAGGVVFVVAWLRQM
ncbi:hypothetical protein [Streptomyces chilikensis]|uniref:Integral membrane protein n=1 Tax=Streptomyces chilikensis TaxID=1194079 RepID=A0ABV3EY62_9ACTN